MRCSLCLQEFGFPVLDPSLSDHSRWAYRLVGPFVLPDYASGGYGAALSIRFFSEVIGRHDHAGVTWSAGQLLKLSSAKSVEADFVLWYQRKQMFGCDYPTDLVFGEAKSFGRDTFKVDDVDRMKLLAEAFPGSVIVFSTMKQASDLAREEINRISRFASWGRERMSDRRGSRAPVLLLTGNELFAGFSLQEAWAKVGGQHAALAKAGRFRSDNLRVLADLTQQLYLGLPSYHAWLDEKWKKKRERKGQSH